MRPRRDLENGARRRRAKRVEDDAQGLRPRHFDVASEHLRLRVRVRRAADPARLADGLEPRRARDLVAGERARAQRRRRFVHPHDLVDEAARRVRLGQLGGDDAERGRLGARRGGGGRVGACCCLELRGRPRGSGKALGDVRRDAED